jgi:hypothetical protein
MTKSVWEKTSEAFAEGGGARQYGGDYLTELRNNWRDNENGITRASGLIVGLAALFEFVILKKAKGATLWGVPLSGSDVVKFALPVIVAYLYYYVTYSFVESTIFQNAHDAVVAQLYPIIYKKDNERELHPANSLISSAERVKFSLGPDGWKARLGTWTGRARPVFIAIVPMAFLVVAYSQLFSKARGLPGLLWASFVITCVLWAASVINLATFINILWGRRASIQRQRKTAAGEPTQSVEDDPSADPA